MGASHHRCSVLLMKARQETTRPAAMLDAIRTFSLGNLQSARAVHEAAAHCMTSQRHVKFLKIAVMGSMLACQPPPRQQGTGTAMAACAQ